MSFDEKKASQVAAYFICKSGGGMHLLKLMKLMYLSAPRSLADYGEPLTWGGLVSMDHGPVLSTTLNLMNGFIPGSGDWDSRISDREDHMLALAREDIDPENDLTYLSDADIGIIEAVWAEFGHMGGFDLCDLTHGIRTEWEDPEASSNPIPYDGILECVGCEPGEVEDLKERTHSKNVIDSVVFRSCSA